jgi:predicted glycoside hydrolase/deacetylase ChbG (UPF0249 family)
VTLCLIVNADDFNLTHGVSQGILEAHHHGIVTNTSVMVNLPGLERSRDLAQSAPALGLGLHLNLTFGPPVLPHKRVASLVDSHGWFIRDHGRLAEAGNVREIREELAAQAARFEDVFGRRPSHLDTHHHVHRHGRIFEAVLDLAAGMGLPVRALTPDMAGRVIGRGLPSPDRAIGDVGPDAYWTAHALLSSLKTLEPGVTELICHPGYADAALADSSYSAQREGEMRGLCDPMVMAAVAAAGIRRIAYGDLAAILASRQ